MSKVIQRCSAAILIQGLFIIAFQIALDIILKVAYLTNCVTVINGFLALAAAFLGFYYGKCKEIKVTIVHIVVLLLIIFLYAGFTISNLIYMIDPEDLKKRINFIVQEIFDLSQEHDEIALRKMDTMQSRLYCCGVNSIVDYGINYPQSCCAPPGLHCSLTNNNVYTRGCAYQAFFVIYNIEIIYTATMTIFLIAPIVAVVMTFLELKKALQLLRYDKRRNEVMGVRGRHYVERDRGDILDNTCRQESLPMQPINRGVSNRSYID